MKKSQLRYFDIQPLLFEKNALAVDVSVCLGDGGGPATTALDVFEYMVMLARPVGKAQ